ncbi:MAG: hypothetical protein AAB428_01515 [Patescibacteria group bacterium]
MFRNIVLILAAAFAVAGCAAGQRLGIVPTHKVVELDEITKMTETRTVDGRTETRETLNKVSVRKDVPYECDVVTVDEAFRLVETRVVDGRTETRAVMEKIPVRKLSAISCPGAFAGRKVGAGTNVGAGNQGYYGGALGSPIVPRGAIADSLPAEFHKYLPPASF